MITTTRSTASLTAQAILLLLGTGFCPGQQVVVAFMLDDFTDTQRIETEASNPGEPIEIGFMIGGDRSPTLYTEVPGPPFGSGGQALDSKLVPIPSFASLQPATSSSFDRVSTSTRNGGGLRLGGADLTHNGGDRFWFDWRDHDHTADGFVTGRDTSNKVAARVSSFDASASRPPDFVMVFADFTNDADTDVINVDRIDFQVLSTEGAPGFTLDFFTVGTVPEPSSAVLLLCFAGLSLRRHRGRLC